MGYVGEVSPEQLEKPEFADLHQGSIVGQYGVEKFFDRLVRGQAGQKSIEVDALGHEKRTVVVEQPHAGDNLYLTIDARLQKVAENLLGEESGAIVALDPRTGDVLAMASRPGFDPNILSRELTPKQWAEIVQDEGRPLEQSSLARAIPAWFGLQSDDGCRSVGNQDRDAVDIYLLQWRVSVRSPRVS